MKTDAQLKKDIQDELDWDPAVRASDIGVIVKEGVVTLTGHLGSFAEKLAAEKAAQRVAGVKALAIEMDVKLQTDDARGDTDIAAAANHALQWNVSVPKGRVVLRVEGGWVTLNGAVEWEYQRKAAERAVHSLAGVVGVSNLLTIMPHVSPVDIQLGIEGALTRQAEREARHLQVLVDGSRVTLRGKVHSWAEHQAAQGAAWSAPGVSSVINELVVA